MSWTEKEFISYLIFHKVSRWQNMIRDKKLLQGKAAFLKNLIARTTTSPSVVSRGKGGTERKKGQKTSRKVNVTINLRGYLNRKKLCWLPHIRKCEAIRLRWPLERGLKIYSYHIGKATHSWIVLSKMQNSSDLQKLAEKNLGIFLPVTPWTRFSVLDSWWTPSTQLAS